MRTTATVASGGSAARINGRRPAVWDGDVGRLRIRDHGHRKVVRTGSRHESTATGITFRFRFDKMKTRDKSCSTSCSTNQ